MDSSNFSEISKDYEKTSSVQQAASEILFNLLKIKPDEDVLDLGCGPGNLTAKIRNMTKGKVIGIDPSQGMIKKAVEKYSGQNLLFQQGSAETLDFKETFDVIFCNSAFQWFKNTRASLKNCLNSLKRGGRMGIQAPAGKIYSPNFHQAIQKVKNTPDLKNTFAHFKLPWIFIETAEGYSNLFRQAGFRVLFSQIKTMSSAYPAENVFEIFKSGASAGYLNQEYYDIPITKDYQQGFLKTVKQSFLEQVKNKTVNLVFNRVFLVAKK